MASYALETRGAHAKPPGPKVKSIYKDNTPGTRGGPGGHDRTLAIKSRKKQLLKKNFLNKKIKTYIPSSYAKI